MYRVSTEPGQHICPWDLEHSLYLDIPFCFWKRLLHTPTGCIIGIERERICALQVQITGQNLHVAAPNVILWRKAKGMKRSIKPNASVQSIKPKSILCTVSTHSQSCAFWSGFQGQMESWWWSGLTSNGFQAFTPFAVTKWEALQQGSPCSVQEGPLTTQDLAQGLPEKTRLTGREKAAGPSTGCVCLSFQTKEKCSGMELMSVP